MTNLPQSDPKLKAAAAEIDAICEKYGIAGFYGLASSTHAEFKVNFPAWSLIQPDSEKGFRIRIKNAEHSHELIESSVHLAYSMRDMAGLQFQNFEAVCKTLAERIDIEHEPFHQLWNLDGWQKPNLKPAPAAIVDFKKRRAKKKSSGKGFGKFGRNDKPIEESWIDFREGAIPQDAFPEQLDAMRIAFYTGALAVLNKAKFAGDCPTEEEGANILQAIEDDCLGWLAKQGGDQ